MGRMLWAVWFATTLMSSPVFGQRDAARVLTIPCAGTVGEQITAEGLSEALTRASRQGVDRVILEIDSPGGYVYEANALIEVLREHAESFEIVAVVDGEALSAASVFLAGADAWLVTPGANIGAAVAFDGDSSTGAAEVDAKFNSVWSSSLSGLAAENGWSGDLFRAMVEPGVTLYVGWGEEGEAPVFSRTWPEGMDRVKRVDTEDTVLALHAGELVEFGLARVIEGRGLEAVAGAMGWGAVRTAGRYGVTSMRKSASERESLAEEVSDLHVQLDWQIARARETDPRGRRMYFDRDTMMLTPASQRLWAQSARDSLGHWSAAEGLLRKLAAVDRRAERAGALHLRVDTASAETTFRTVSENVSYLRANQRRTHYQLDP